MYLKYSENIANECVKLYLLSSKNTEIPNILLLFSLPDTYSLAFVIHLDRKKNGVNRSFWSGFENCILRVFRAFLFKYLTLVNLTYHKRYKILENVVNA